MDDIKLQNCLKVKLEQFIGRFCEIDLKIEMVFPTIKWNKYKLITVYFVLVSGQGVFCRFTQYSFPD